MIRISGFRETKPTKRLRISNIYTICNGENETNDGQIESSKQTHTWFWLLDNFFFENNLEGKRSSAFDLVFIHFSNKWFQIKLFPSSIKVKKSQWYVWSYFVFHYFANLNSDLKQKPRPMFVFISFFTLPTLDAEYDYLKVIKTKRYGTYDAASKRNNYMNYF